MATRCCSARCSAERKGFRRELDSWRHKLIHCVGFESILEGIYGPRLLHDLSIFVNCEPDVTADWSTDVRCSFCNLQLEKNSDRLPDSPPQAETPPQGINTSDTLQCQADRFLHAVLHKKEFPESCDPIIPLAAQELMRKMIRQFAVEYAHKIQTTENQNAVTQTEPDGPLDLTLSRNTQCAQQDGVLDLSKKNTPSLNTLAQQRLSGCLETEEDENKSKEREVEQERRGTALEEVMTALCTHHRNLLLHMLQETKSLLPEDQHGVTAAHQTVRNLKNGHDGHCCQANESPCVSSSCVATGCACPCELGVCAVRSVCGYMKCCSELSCQSITRGGSQKLVSHHAESDDITHVAQTSSITCPHRNSPSPPPLSPPPLSPKPQDTGSSCEPDMPMLNTHTPNTQTPLLLLHNTHTDQTLTPETKPEHFIDLMDKFTDTLMEASAREWNVHTRMGDGVKACDDTHLTEIITTVLHRSSEKDYNLKELFEQHLASEKRSPQTRSQRRQEVMQAISRSPDQAATRRQSLQIKRDLARLKSNISRKKEKKMQLIAMDTHNQVPGTSISHPHNPDTPTQSSDTLVPHTQSLVTCILHTLNQDQSILPAQSPDTAISHKQNSDTPISNAQSLDTPIPHTPSPHTPILNDQSLYMPSSHTQTPEIPMSHAQSLYTPMLQSPDKSISHTQNPEAPILDLQTPDMPISQVQRPYTQILQVQRPGTPISHFRCPDKLISQPQTSEVMVSPGTPVLHAQTLVKPSLHTQTPDMAGLHTQSSDTPGSHSQSLESEASGNARLRRHIVRPQHLSSYITETRKMFYTACRSLKNNTTPTHEIDIFEPSPNALIEHLRTPLVLPNERNYENSAQSYAENRSGVKTRYSKEVIRSPSPVVTDCMDTDDVKYASPIKLMLVSTMKDDDGVKYTLRAAETYSDEESFDPFLEASWAGKTIEAKDESVQTADSKCTDKPSTDESSSAEARRGDYVSSINEAEPTIKRRPGRPKKLKPLPEKAVKRPIGRPRKSKPVDTNTVSSEDAVKQKIEDSLTGENGKKNLKITITYGRRKTQRMVSEGQVHTEQRTGSRASTLIGNVKEPAESTQAQVSTNKGQFGSIIPTEDRKNLTLSIMCPKQSDEAGTRRPGRPAKVKISGISVTVTTDSPGQRKIHIRQNVKEPVIRRQARLTKLEPNEKQETITEEGHISVRHSVRERRPSVHLLQSVAMSRSNTQLPRSRKLLLHKAKKTQQQTPKHKNAGDTARPNTFPQDATHFSAASGESLFDANLQWWPTSASPDTLREEMKRRLNVMKETWVSDTTDRDASDEDTSSAQSSSAVRLLFERDCSMDTLSSWFMQTTETQSLSIVKKVTNRNPCEFFQYSSSQVSKRPNVSWSPQAERLRKCIKKFATVVPKSPTKLRQAQEKLSDTKNCFTKQQVFNTSLDNAEKSQKCGAWHLYRAALDRARLRFKSRTKNTDVDYKRFNEQEEGKIQSVSVSEHGLVDTLKSESRRTSTQQNEVTANAWNAHTLRECKVFLRKLNSPNTRSMSEESNDCSVRFSISPAAGGLVPPQREQGAKKSITLKRTSISGACTQQQSNGNRKRRQSCTNVSPPSLKQRRSSRGVMAAKWSDFILGPAK